MSRRTKEQWQELCRTFKQSNIPITHFCKTHRICHSNFKKKLGECEGDKELTIPTANKQWVKVSSTSDAKVVSSNTPTQEAHIHISTSKVTIVIPAMASASLVTAIVKQALSA